MDWCNKPRTNFEEIVVPLVRIGQQVTLLIGWLIAVVLLKRNVFLTTHKAVFRFPSCVQYWSTCLLTS
jgi:hypothetical protein